MQRTWSAKKKAIRKALPPNGTSNRIKALMAEILTFDQIKTRYDGEWVLIGDPVTDDSLSVRPGEVLWHSKDREKFRTLPKDAAIVL